METEGFYMAEKRWRTWETVGLLVVLAAGNLLHFIYDWTGQSPIAAPLAAVNESTWEHMKLFITPWVLWSLVECIALRGHGSPPVDWGCWRALRPSRRCFTPIREFWAGGSCGWMY